MQKMTVIYLPEDVDTRNQILQEFISFGFEPKQQFDSFNREWRPYEILKLYPKSMALTWLHASPAFFRDSDIYRIRGTFSFTDEQRVMFMLGMNIFDQCDFLERVA